MASNGKLDRQRKKFWYKGDFIGWLEYHLDKDVFLHTHLNYEEDVVEQDEILIKILNIWETFNNIDIPTIYEWIEYMLEKGISNIDYGTYNDNRNMNKETHFIAGWEKAVGMPIVLNMNMGG